MKSMRFSGRHRSLLILGAALLSLPLVVPNVYLLSVVNDTLVIAVIAVGFCLLLGNAGQISLGHAAFYAIGGYTSAILTTRFDWPPLAALLLGVGGVTVLALLVAWPLLRLRGHHLAIATLGLGLIVEMVLVNEVAWTGGPDGLYVPALSLGGVVVGGEVPWFYVFAGLLLLNLWLSHNLLDSPAGRGLRALHGSEIAAQVSGIDVGSYKVWIFVYSAALTGLMGSLGSHYVGFIDPRASSLLASLYYLMAVVIGGRESPYGAIVGAVVVTVLPALLVGVGDYEMLVFGSILLLTVMLLPRGVYPSLASLLGSKA